MNRNITSLDISEFTQAQAEIKTELRVLGDFFNRSGYDKYVYIDELIKTVESELSIKLSYEREDKKRG
jgi:hypothetical protein